MADNKSLDPYQYHADTQGDSFAYCLGYNKGLSGLSNYLRFYSNQLNKWLDLGYIDGQGDRNAPDDKLGW